MERMNKNRVAQQIYTEPTWMAILEEDGPENILKNGVHSQKNQEGQLKKRMNVNKKGFSYIYLVLT